MKWIIPFVLVACLSVFGQAPPQISAVDAKEKIRYDMRKLLGPAGEAYRQLLMEGPSAASYEKLGGLYFDEEKPFQSKHYYEMALALKPDSEAAKAGHDRAVERIQFLDDRFRMFSDKANNGGDATNFGSMAAIKYHQGFHLEAFEILKDAQAVYGQDARVAPLAQTFERDIEYRLTVLEELLSQYRAIDLDTASNEAVKTLGKMVFVSFGNPSMLQIFDELRKSRPELINEESYLLLREFVRTYPNQKS